MHPDDLYEEFIRLARDVPPEFCGNLSQPSTRMFFFVGGRDQGIGARFPRRVLQTCAEQGQFPH